MTSERVRKLMCSKLRYLNLVILIFLFQYGYLWGEGIKSIHPNKPIHSLVLKQWTAEDGLISNNLTAINKDADGFLWIACFNGTLKFDGNTFQLFDTEKLDFLNSNAFMDLEIAGSNTIWFSTQASGIVLNKQGNFIYPDFNLYLPKSIRNIHIDGEKSFNETAHPTNCGDINILVGLEDETTVKGIKIVSQEETPGLGTRITEPFFTDQFAGIAIKDIALSRDGGKIDAITSSTISSSAVVDAVRATVMEKVKQLEGSD